jgi:hypothetical protein
MNAPVRLMSLVWAAFLCVVGVVAISASGQSGLPDSASAGGAPEAAPGIPLPANGLVWILDPVATKPDLSRLYVHSGAENQHRGRNLAEGAVFSFFSNVKITIDLPGPSAGTRTKSNTPVLFVRMTTDEQEAEDSRAAGSEPVGKYQLVLLGVERAGKNRVVFGFASSSGGLSKPKMVASQVAILTQQIGNEWRKITPQQPLANGEYAVTWENDAGTNATADVYDFGVGPAPPAKNP